MNSANYAKAISHKILAFILSAKFINSASRPADSIWVFRRFPHMDIAINIATSGRCDLLKRTLNSLAECQLPPGYAETVVVENGTPAGAQDVLRAAPSILKARYMHVPTRNKSAATNAALETLDNALVFFTDDDVRVAPTILSAYADAAQRNSTLHFFGGPTNAEYDVPPPDWLRKYLPVSATGWERARNDESADAHPAKSMKFIGFNWAAFAADIRAAGGFNREFGPGSPTGSTGQETEMQLRLLEKGFTATYVPEARVWHYVPSSRCTPEWTIDRVYRNGVQDGLLGRNGASAFASLPPWWITRRYLKGIIRSWIWSLTGGPEGVFMAKYRRSYDRGLIRGFRSRRNAALNPPGAKSAPATLQLRKKPLHPPI